MHSGCQSLERVKQNQLDALNKQFTEPNLRPRGSRIDLQPADKKDKESLRIFRNFIKCRFNHQAD